MKKLHELVELVSNTEEAVVLKVKDGCQMDLICLGCFNGDESVLRLNKGRSITCTIWTTKGTHYSWEWGDGGHTLVTENMTKKGRMIQQCVEDYFDILVYGYKESIREDMRKPSDISIHHLQLWENAGPGHDCGCRKDNEFYRFFPSLAAALQHFEDLGYEVVFQNKKPNCCNSITYYYEITK